MKKFVVFTLLAGAGATLYLYKTNPAFKHRIDSLFITEHSEGEYYGNDTGSDADTIKKEQGKTVSSTSKKTSKKVLAPGPYAALDAYAKNTPKAKETGIAPLAAYLSAGAANELGKTRILFTWIATHIKYDDTGYNTGNLGDCSAATVFTSRRAVCEGYSNLFKELGTAMGLRVEKVVGYAKGYAYKAGDSFTESNHAWNAVKLDGKWKLFDATWAAGYGMTKNKKLVSVTKFEPYWFDVNPKEFIFTHFPEEPKWILTGMALNLQQYESLPYVEPIFFSYGFNADLIYKNAVSGKIKELVEVYSSDFPVKVIDVPVVRTLKKGQERKFIIHSDYAEEMALIDGTEWIYFTRNGSEFSCTYIPKSTTLLVSYKANPTDKSFSTIMKYKVAAMDAAS